MSFHSNAVSSILASRDFRRQRECATAGYSRSIGVSSLAYLFIGLCYTLTHSSVLQVKRCAPTTVIAHLTKLFIAIFVEIFASNPIVKTHSFELGEFLTCK